MNFSIYSFKGRAAYYIQLFSSIKEALGYFQSEFHLTLRTLSNVGEQLPDAQLIYIHKLCGMGKVLHCQKPKKHLNPL